MTAGYATCPDRRAASDIMVRAPKTMPATSDVRDTETAFADGHVHMLLLVDNGVLIGTITRGDLDLSVPGTAPATSIAHLTGRVVGPTDSIATVWALLQKTGRRLAVIDDNGALLGLICLKRDRSGFCTDAGIADRACAAQDTTAANNTALTHL